MKKNRLIFKSILLSAMLISPVALLASNPNTVFMPVSSYKETKFNRPTDVDWDKEWETAQSISDDDWGFSIMNGPEIEFNNIKYDRNVDNGTLSFDVDFYFDVFETMKKLEGITDEDWDNLRDWEKINMVYEYQYRLINPTDFDLEVGLYSDDGDDNPYDLDESHTLSKEPTKGEYNKQYKYIKEGQRDFNDVEIASTTVHYNTGLGYDGSKENIGEHYIPRLKDENGNISDEEGWEWYTDLARVEEDADELHNFKLKDDPDHWGVRHWYWNGETDLGWTSLDNEKYTDHRAGSFMVTDKRLDNGGFEDYNVLWNTLSLQTMYHYNQYIGYGPTESIKLTGLNDALSKPNINDLYLFANVTNPTFNNPWSHKMGLFRQGIDLIDGIPDGFETWNFNKDNEYYTVSNTDTIFNTPLFKNNGVYADEIDIINEIETNEPDYTTFEFNVSTVGVDNSSTDKTDEEWVNEHILPYKIEVYNGNELINTSETFTDIDNHIVDVPHVENGTEVTFKVVTEGTPLNDNGFTGNIDTHPSTIAKVGKVNGTTYHINNISDIKTTSLTNNSANIEFDANIKYPYSNDTEVEEYTIEILNNGNVIATENYNTSGHKTISLTGLDPNEEYNLTINSSIGDIRNPNIKFGTKSSHIGIIVGSVVIIAIILTAGIVVGVVFLKKKKE